MKKIIKKLLFAFMLVAGLIFVSCGEKKEELTGLHKEFDIIFNGIKNEVMSEFEANKEAVEKEFKDSTQNELEAKLALSGFEVLLEGFKKSTYDVENIDDMGDKAEIKIKVKSLDFFEALQQTVANISADKENVLKEVQGLLKKIKNGDAPILEQEMTIEMFKENDKWTISDDLKVVLGKRMMGIQKGSIFDY